MRPSWQSPQSLWCCLGDMPCEVLWRGRHKAALRSGYPYLLIYLPNHPPAYSSVHLQSSCLLNHPPTHPPTHLPTHLSVFQSISTHLPANPPTYLPTDPPAYPYTHPHTRLLLTSPFSHPLAHSHKHLPTHLPAHQPAHSIPRYATQTKVCIQHQQVLPCCPMVHQHCLTMTIH